MLLVLIAILAPLTTTNAAARIAIVNLDGPNEGFNDPTPFTPMGGNFATTLGQARLNAFQYAADRIALLLNSSVEIRVDAQINSLGGSANSAILGAAGPRTAYANFPNAPQQFTWYPAALADKLAGSDRNPTIPDISAEFNGDVDNNVVLGTSDWYYGLDGSPPGGDIDFVTVVAHELLHGLGFLTLVDLNTGAKFNGFDDAYMLHLEDHSTIKNFPSMTDAERVTAITDTGDLHWTGAQITARIGSLAQGVSGNHVEMYAPSTVQPGSSVSHFSTSLFPNNLMEPFYSGPNHNAALVAYLLEDIGWGAPNIGPGDADLEVTLQESVDPIVVGANLTYTATVTNNG
ncbi:MAG: hypothetical protein JSW10_08810, partial [Pseudomonadota bacterium]